MNVGSRTGRHVLVPQTPTLGIAVPASAQVFVGADAGGAGVRVGPVGVGVGPDYGWRHRHYYGDDYAYSPGGCRVIRDRVVTPSGRVIIRTHRDCY
jgi:hypothetical protein